MISGISHAMTGGSRSADVDVDLDPTLEVDGNVRRRPHLCPERLALVREFSNVQVQRGLNVYVADKVNAGGKVDRKGQHQGQIALRRRTMMCAAVVAVAMFAASASAQIAGAIGKPLPSPDLPVGTISVRVVAGSVASPVNNTEVTLVVNGEPRVARTDTAGRAQFKDLPVGATVRAKIASEDPKDAQSEEFPVPSDSGARVMLSTKPFVPIGGAGAASGGMPEPLKMSGEPRPEPTDPPGTITVRLTYDDFKDTAPVDIPVALVGYTAQEQVEIRTVRTDPDGRAVFANLDRTSSVAYFAMAQLPRNSAMDRMISAPIVLDARGGSRVVLSAAKRTSTDPPLDGFARFETQDAAVAPGRIRVTLDGVPDPAADVHLVAIHVSPAAAVGVPERRQIGTTQPTRAAPDPENEQGKWVADFDASGVGPDEAVYAETNMRGTMYRSMPFQPLAAPGRGTGVTLYVYPRILFSFSLTSRVDDEFLAVSGRFVVSNNSWAPYVGGSDGLVIPLPKQFKGAIVAEKDQSDVAVTTGEGFRIGKPIPPGGKQFHAGFSLPIDGGRAEWAMDLPLGTFQSGLEILETPGMQVQLPPSVAGETMTVPKGRYFVLPSISILPKQSMVMTVTGLPTAPAWRIWVPRAAGLAVIATIVIGIVVALRSARASRDTAGSRSQRRAALLDELVELERENKDPKRRNQITAELETLWDDAG